MYICQEGTRRGRAPHRPRRGAPDRGEIEKGRYVCVCICMCMCIYIYIEYREREIDICIHIYIYIYMYICRERDIHVYIHILILFIYIYIYYTILYFVGCRPRGRRLPLWRRRPKIRRGGHKWPVILYHAYHVI